MLSREARHLIESVFVVFAAPLVMMSVVIAGVPDVPNAADPALATLADVSGPTGDERSPFVETTGDSAERPSVAPGSATNHPGADVRGAAKNGVDAAGSPGGPTPASAQAEPSEPSAPASNPADPASEEGADEPTDPPVADDAGRAAPASDETIRGALDTVQPALDAVDQALDETEQLLTPILGPVR